MALEDMGVLEVTDWEVLEVMALEVSAMEAMEVMVDLVDMVSVDMALVMAMVDLDTMGFGRDRPMKMINNERRGQKCSRALSWSSRLGANQRHFKNFQVSISILGRLWGIRWLWPRRPRRLWVKS